MGGDITVKNSTSDVIAQEYPGTKEQIESHVKAYGCECAVVLKPKNSALIHCSASEGICSDGGTKMRGN